DTIDLTQILLRRHIDIAGDFYMGPAIADIGCLRNPSAGQFSLEAEFPTLIVGRERFGVEEGDALPEEGSRAVSCSRRLQDPIWERIGQRPGEVNPIGRWNKVGVPTEPALNDVTTALAQEPEEDSITGADDSLVVQLIGQTYSRHVAVLRRLIQPIRLAIDA